MLKIKIVVLFFLFLYQTAEGKELSPDIQLLIAHGFIKEAKLELIAVARNPANSDPEKIQALLLLDTTASNNTEKRVVLEMLCDIDNKYLPQLKQFEADVLKEKEQEKLAQQRLRDEKEAKRYLEYAKLWRERIQGKKKESEDEDAEIYYDYNELVESMEFCLSKALSLGHHSDVSHEAFDFYFDILFQDLISYKYGFFSVKLDAKKFDSGMAKIVSAIQSYETLYPDSPKILELIWYVHDIFYRQATDNRVPRSKDKVKPEHRGLAYYGSAIDFFMLSISWLDRIMEKSGDENFYSNMARRKYRFMQRAILDLISKNQKFTRYDPYSDYSGTLFFKVGSHDIKKMKEEVEKRVSMYPVLNPRVLE